MKITLAFDIFNKEKWMVSLLDSWVSRLSGKYDYEIVIVFDDLKDRSYDLAREYLEKTTYEYKFLFADNKYEIFCNNLALEHATGDFIIFIQDDNWIFDENWDVTLVSTIENTNNIGTIGLLAGLKFLPSLIYSDPKGSFNFTSRIKPLICQLLGKSQEVEIPGALQYERIEIDRPHKGEEFAKFKLIPFEFGIWQVDAVIRPFCVSVSLLKTLGGLDKAYMPSCGDDMDLSIKLLQQGKTNLYIPFDVLNTTGSHSTMDRTFIDHVIQNALKILFNRYGNYFSKEWVSTVKLLSSLEVLPEGTISSKN